MASSRSGRTQGLEKVERVTTLMADLEKVVLTVEVSKATERDLRALIATHLWSAEDGLRIILGAGIGVLLAEEVRDAASDSARAFARQLAETEGRLAAVRYELSDAREQLKRWELSSGAIASLAQNLEDTLRRQNGEIEALKELLKERDQELAALRQKGQGPMAKSVR
jgi:hypothetical protein